MTAVTEAFIRRMWAEGVPAPKIASYLGCSLSLIRLRARQLGLPLRVAGRPRTTPSNQTQSAQVNTNSCDELQTQSET